MNAERYLIVIEDAGSNFSAYSPDVPGCVATGPSIQVTVDHMKDALILHMQGTAEDGDSIPKPRGDASYREALQQSAGETYYMTHIELDVDQFEPSGIAAR